MPVENSTWRGRSATHRTARGGWPVYLIGGLTLAVAAVAVPSAIDLYGQPVAGALVGPDAVVSGVMNSNWDGARQGLDFPDRIMAIEDIRLDALPESERGLRLSQIVRRVAGAGASHVTVDLHDGASERRIRLAIERLDGATWWLVAGSLFFAGALFLMAGLVALWASPRTPLARSFAVLASATALFMFTFFDYHTSYRLVPIFLISFALLPGAMCMLALRLPDDAPLLRRYPWLERATAGAGIAVAAYFVVPFMLGRPMPHLHQFWSGVLGACFLLFALTFLVRLLLAKGHRRDILRALTVAMAPPLAALGLIMAAEPLVGRFSHADVLVYPALPLAPIAVAFAFVRYDLWGSRALLSRIITRLVIGAIACMIAIGAGAALATEMGVPFRSAAVAATIGGVAAAVLVVLALFAAETYVFPSRASYKPTTEQLSEDLISITSPEEVGRAIERTVRRWLPCEHIRLVPTPGGTATIPEEPAVSAPASEGHTEEISPYAPATESRHRADGPDPSGMKRAAPHPPISARRPLPAARGEVSGQGSSDLVLPVVFGTERLGVLEVGAKPGGALFTSDDLDLLGTVVNQGALALAHARAYQELEQRRKQQAAAWKGEREALVETVAAEISHEIRYPLNFFRSLFSRTLGQPLAPEDVDIGREEVERLERLVGGLRRMVAHRIHLRSVSIRDLCSHAETLLRDAASGRPLSFAGENTLTIRCDPDQATQILVNLLANALQATGDSGHAGVSWRRDGTDTRIEVWDDGPGFAGDPAMLFAPWYTTKERGTGLGLAITHRLVRAHGWSIEASRLDGKTLFTVKVPKSDVVQTADLPAQESRTEVS